MVVTRIAFGLLAGLIAGCSSLPLCGSPEAQGQACTDGWAGVMRDANAISGPQRNYVTNPVTLPPAQPNQSVAINPAQEEYKLILVDGPGGWAYRRCKVLKGQVVACF